MSTQTDAAKMYAASPYKKAYGDIWADIKELKGIVTKSELVNRMMKRTGKDEKACLASVGVILSPRETSKGDCRGNASAKGHLYFFAKLKRKTDENGVKEEQRYRFQWRKEVLEPKTRSGSTTETPAPPVVQSTVEDQTDATDADAEVVDQVDADAELA